MRRWLLMRQAEGAQFLFRMAKAARKHWAGLAVITQDAEDVLSSELGRAVVSNAATQILLRQAPQAISQVAEAFRLSAGEREFLLSARQGEGLLAASATDRVAFKTVASDVRAPARHHFPRVPGHPRRRRAAARQRRGRLLRRQPCRPRPGTHSSEESR